MHTNTSAFGSATLLATVLCALTAVPLPPLAAADRAVPETSFNAWWYKPETWKNPFPFDPPAVATLRASRKKVFAHFFTPTPVSIDNKEWTDDYYDIQYCNPEGENGKFRGQGGMIRQRPLPRPVIHDKDWAERDMESQVRLAIAMGIDGFSWNIFQGHVDRGLSLMDAAVKIDKGFKILLMPDMEGYGADPQPLREILPKLCAHPAVYRLSDGRVVLAPYNAMKQSPQWWRITIEGLQSQGIKVAFVPLFQGWERYAAEYAPISDGFSDWNTGGPTQMKRYSDVAASVRKYVSLWMQPVCPQAFVASGLGYWEPVNSEGYRQGWMSAIEGDADWVQIVTWNDIGESTCIFPTSAGQLAWYDLTAYYVSWFKTGAPPKIQRDVLYYFHRIQSTTAKPQSPLQKGLFKNNGSEPSSDQIELLAFLSKPGIIEIEVGGESKRLDAPAGITSFKVPLVEGKPIFRLLRDNAKVIELPGAFEISNKRDFTDLLYRAGSSSRNPVFPR